MLLSFLLNYFRNSKPSKRTPSYKKLKEEGNIYQTPFTVGQSTITIYDNGYVLYEKKIENKIYRTVFHINEIKYTFNFVTGESVSYEATVFSGMLAKDVLYIVGENGLEHNADAREQNHTEYHLNNDGNDWTEEACTPPDMVENEAMTYFTRVENEETLKKLNDTIQYLTEKQHEVIKKIYFENKTVTETAKELGLSRNTVNDHHNGALKKIRKYF